MNEGRKGTKRKRTGSTAEFSGMEATTVPSIPTAEGIERKTGN